MVLFFQKVSFSLRLGIRLEDEPLVKNFSRKRTVRKRSQKTEI